MEHLQSRSWNPAWAERVPNCKAAFEQVKEYLERGDGEQKKEREREAGRVAKELADAAALADAAEARANAERRSKEDAQARAEAERRAKEDAESRAEAESKAKVEAEARANAEEKAKNGAEALAKTQRRTNRILSLAGVFVAGLLGLVIWSQIRVNKLLETQSNAPQKGQGDLQAKLGEKVKARVNGWDGLSYVFIPDGKFQMGCSPGDSDCEADEKPAHEVTISQGFWLSQTDVTQAAWKRVMNTDPATSKASSCRWKALAGVML